MAVKYVPHHAVTSHPRGYLLDQAGVFSRRGAAEMVNMIKTWKEMRHISTQTDFQVMMKAIIWDLKTHYGVTDKDLGPPSPYFPV